MPPKKAGRGRKRADETETLQVVENVDYNLEFDKLLNGNVKDGKSDSVVISDVLKTDENIVKDVNKNGNEETLNGGETDQIATIDAVNDVVVDVNKIEVPKKRGRKKGTVEKDAVEAPTEIADGHSNEDPAKPNGNETDQTAAPNNESTDILEVRAKVEVPKKRGRKKAAEKDVEEPSTVDTADEAPVELNGGETDEKAATGNESNHISEDTVEVPKKRGRKKATAEKDAVDASTVKTADQSNEVPEELNAGETKISNESNDVSEDIVEVPKKRGRKKAVAAEQEAVEAPTAKVVEVPSRRGRKKVKDADNEDEEKVQPEVKSRSTRVQKKKVAEDEPVSDVEAPKPEEIENPETKTKRNRPGRNKKQESEAAPVQEAPKAGRKRKTVQTKTVIETKKVKSDSAGESKFVHNCKVLIQRDDDLDKRSLEEATVTKSTKSDSSKPAARGKRAKSEDNSTPEGNAKPAKIPKEAPKSKGQSKKDKMPDVTLLDFTNTSKSSSGELWNLKLSSWNVNGVRAWLEKDGLAFLQHESPDVMCVQETKCAEDKLPKEVNVEGYHCYWLAGDTDGYSGVGILSKTKPASVTFGIDMEEHDKDGRVITAEFDKFYLVNTYVPNAGRGLVRLDYRKQWDKDFLSYLKKLDEKKPVVLCGDLNVAHEEIDLKNPKTNKKNAGFTQEERDGFSTLLSSGFIDSFRHLYPDEKAYTFWTYMMNARAKDVGWRLDYFVVSKRFADLVCDNVIRKDVFGSDHCPITLFLSL